MAINRKLLPIKAHFFFHLAGCAPVFPFITLIIKELGFSATITGVINTIAPILCMVAKPIVGAAADKFKIHKSLLVFIVLSAGAAMISLCFLKPLPMRSEVELQCDSQSARLLINTSKANDECFVGSLAKSIKNSRMKCKFIMTGDQNSFIAALAQNQTKGDEPVMKDSSLWMMSPNIINLVDASKEDENTILVPVDRLVKSNQEWFPLRCQNSTGTSGFLYCPDPMLHEITNEVKIPDDEVVNYSAFWYLFLIILLVRVVGSCSENLSDSICFKMLSTEGNPHDYGLQRLWGSGGWGLMSAISGYLVDKMSAGKPTSDRRIAFYLSGAFLLLDIAVLLKLKVKDGGEKKKTEKIWSNVGKLLKNNPKFLVFLALVTFCGIFSSLLWNFLFWFIVEIAKEDGCRDNSRIQTLNGLVLAVNCYLGELPFFFFIGIYAFTGWFLKKIGYEHCLTLVLVAFGVRFIGYFFLTNPWLILPLEVLNGLTFGLFYSTMTTYANALTPPGLEGTMQGLVAATFEGIGLSFGSLLGGYLFDKIGGRMVFLYGGSVSLFLAAAHCILLLTWMSPGDRRIADSDEDSDEYHVPDMTISPEHHNHDQEWD